MTEIEIKRNRMHQIDLRVESLEHANDRVMERSGCSSRRIEAQINELMDERQQLFREVNGIV